MEVSGQLHTPAGSTTVLCLYNLLIFWFIQIVTLFWNTRQDGVKILVVMCNTYITIQDALKWVTILLSLLLLPPPPPPLLLLLLVALLQLKMHRIQNSLIVEVKQTRGRSVYVKCRVSCLHSQVSCVAAFQMRLYTTCY